MTAPLEQPPPSSGKDLIAAYRAARLGQRPVLRTSLYQSHVGRLPPRTGAVGLPGAEAPADMEAEAPPAAEAAAPAAVEAAVPAEPVAVAGDAASPAQGARDAPPAGPPRPLRELPLAAIGFGPAMLIRLGQLGVYSTGDLACAEPSVLRAALGDASRLVDVDAWIARARQAAAGGPEEQMDPAA